MPKEILPGMPSLSTEYDVWTELPAKAGSPDNEGFVVADGVFYQSGSEWLYCRKDTPETRDLLRLLGLLRVGREETSGPRTPAEAWTRILSGSSSTETEKDWMTRFRLKQDMVRRVILIQLRDGRKQTLMKILQDVAPVEAGDSLIPMKRDQVVLLKELNESDPEEESEEYAMALRETMESETGMLPVIAMGQVVNGMQKVRESYLQALQALEAGSRFYPKESVYVYDHLILEIFLDGLPEESLEPWRKRFRSPAVQKVMTDEMMETVRMFFRLDLNISDTARQLFIHRNTLNYRLEKIQRVTGLDLRKFEDAVIFRLFADLPV